MNRSQVVDRQFRSLVTVACTGSWAEYETALKELVTVDRQNTVDHDQILALKVIALSREGKTVEAKENYHSLLESNKELVLSFVLPKLENAPESNSDDYLSFVRKLGAIEAASRKNAFEKIKVVPVSIALGIIFISVAIWIRTHPDSGVNLELDNSSEHLMVRMRQAVPLVVTRAKVLRDDGSHFWVPLGQGTGFVVNEKGLLLTNRHVVDIEEEDLESLREIAASNSCVVSKTDIAVVFDVGGENRVIEGLSAQISQDVDLAWIELIRAESYDYLSFAPMPVATDVVFALGYAGSSADFQKYLNPDAQLERKVGTATIFLQDNGKTWLDLLGIENYGLEPFKGIVNDIRKSESGILIHHQAPSSKGNSGGPLVNEDGRVVGIITWGHLMEESKQRALSVLTIYDELKNQKDMVWPVTVLRFHEVTTFEEDESSSIEAP